MIKGINITSDGFFPDENGVSTLGGMKSWVASGNFGGGSLVLQCKILGVTDWVNADDNGVSAVMQSSGVKNVLLSPNVNYRVQLEGSTGPDLSFGI